MGFFDQLFGTGSASPEPWKNWDSLAIEDRISAGEVLFKRVLADCPFITSSFIRAKPDDHSVDLEGKARGIAFRVRVGAGGRLEIKLKYPRVEMPYLDLEYDPAAIESPFDDKPFEADEQRCFVAPHVFFEGSDAAEELATFKKLPDTMRARILAAIDLGRPRYFRSRYEDLQADCGPDIHEIGSPLQYIVSMLDVASELTVHRIAAAAAALKEIKASEGERMFAHFSKIKDTDQRLELVEKAFTQFVQESRFSLPKTTKVVVRKNDQKVDLRWIEQGIPVRVVADLEFDDLDIDARAEGIDCELEIERDDEIDLLNEPAEEDEWSGAGSRRVFLAKNICIEGSEASTREQVALLRAIPKDLYAALLRDMSIDFKWLELSEGRLHTGVIDLSKAELRHVESAVSIAKLFARIISALPRGRPTGITDKAQHCRFCHARWFDSPTCTHCGAPA